MRVWQKVYIGKDKDKTANKVITGYNDLFTYCMKSGKLNIIEAYNLANNELPITKVACTSYVKFIKLKCKKCGHINVLRAMYVNRKHMCEACAAREGNARTVVTGANDLETWCKENNRLDILADYHSKNELKPSELSKTSHTEVFWECQKVLSDGSKCGYIWETMVSHRTFHNNGCPACKARSGSGTTLVQSINDLKTWCLESNRADILANWNCVLKPENVSAKNDENQVTVKCRLCGKDIVTYPYILARSPMSTTCNNCKIPGTSVPQLMLYNILLRYFPSTKHREKIAGMEADIFIPEIRLVIEYNGHYHLEPDKQVSDAHKENTFRQLGLQVLIIQEYPTKDFPVSTVGNRIHIWYKNNKEPETYQTILNKINKAYHTNMQLQNADITAATDQAYDVMQRKDVSNSIAETDTDIIKLWDYEKNGNLRPEGFTRGSHKEVYWVCNDCAVTHSYKMEIRKKCMGRGCPLKSGKRIEIGVNDLFTVAPEFMRYCWNQGGNIGLGMDPLVLAANSHKNIAVICPHCGTKWTDMVANVVGTPLRTGKSAICPYCKRGIPLK